MLSSCIRSRSSEPDSVRRSGFVALAGRGSESLPENFALIWLGAATGAAWSAKLSSESEATILCVRKAQHGSGILFGNQRPFVLSDLPVWKIDAIAFGAVIQM